MFRASVAVFILFSVAGAAGAAGADEPKGNAEPKPRALTIKIEKTPKPTSRPKKPKGPVILDARPAFDYATGHVKNALSIRWQDYDQTEPPHKGDLDPDNDLLARKLRVLGITPESEVAVIGNGPDGKGEEGRIAWMLVYLGVSKVEIKNVKNLKLPRTTEETGWRDSAAVWLPKTNPVRIQKRELMERLAGGKDLPVIVDVRDADEFKTKHIKNAVNVNWKLFFNKDGELMSDDNIVRVFKENKIDTNRELVFYCNMGLRGGYVTFAAWKAKLNAKLYDGGLVEWSADPQAPVQ